jgi:sigma-B regulation protein RsbU (phosphoserine phosphatase)
MLERLNEMGILCTTPVIMLTPADTTLGIDRCLELGAGDYLAAPFIPAVVQARINAGLTRQQLQAQQQDAAGHELLLTIERDVQIARQIQLGFLPNQLPQPAGWEITASFHPAREVAGDFYDAFMLTQNRRVGLVIADVCDKGVGAALFMSLSRSLIRAFAQQHYSISDWTSLLVDDKPARSRNRSQSTGRQAMPSIGAAALKNAMTLTNNYITTNHLEMNMFVTLFFGVLDPLTGALIYVNGGHSPPAIVSPEGVIKARLAPTGPAVGLFPDVSFEIAHAQLAPGDMLFCYTDGVTDARNPEREFFGEPRLQQLLAQPAPSAAALLNRFEGHLQAHIASADQFDDITMLAARWVPEESPAA